MELIIRWISGNYIELLGAILGIVYIFFSIRQSILTWPVGLLTSVLYVWVFLVSKLYADMGLQMYYVVISIYGWYEWLRGNQSNHSEPLKISRLSLKLGLRLVGISILIFLLIWYISYILTNYTDSQVPKADALATALSIVATWMLARKILEQWLVWIFVDAFSMGLFIYKGLLPTVILFAVYTVMAYIGYLEWKKDLVEETTEVNFNKQIRIVVTGPESTGKTTLAKQLAEFYHGQYIQEYAREYIEKLPHPYTYEDVEDIAKAQVKQFQETQSSLDRVFIFDTWLIITKVWFDWVFGKTPLWIEGQIRGCPMELFLLCEPDLPWEADRVRENGGENRVKLFMQYRKELVHYGFNFVEISGTGDERLTNAIAAINNVCELTKTLG